MHGQRSKNGFYNKKIRMACIIKQLLDSVFVISGIIKVSVSVISLSLRLRLITLTSTLIIPDITKTESNNCLLASSSNFRVCVDRVLWCKHSNETCSAVLSVQTVYLICSFNF